MRENRFSENSCSGRKTNSPSLSLQFDWRADAGAAALCPGPQADLAADGRLEELALLLFSFPTVTVGHGDTLLYELWMRLTVALTKDPLWASCHPLWGRIKPRPLGLYEILLVRGTDGEGRRACQGSPDADF